MSDVTNDERPKPRPMVLTIVVEFPDGLSEIGQQDMKRAIQSFKEDLYVGKMVKASLVTK